MPLDERQRAAIQLNQTSATNEIATANGVDSYGGGLAPLPDLSALETLAEVSRHHLDYQTQVLHGNSHESQQRSPKRRKIHNRGQPGTGHLQHPNDQVSSEGHLPQHYLAQTDDEAQSLAQALYEAQEIGDPDPATEFLVQDDSVEPDATERLDNLSALDSAATSLQLAASAASELMGPQAPTKTLASRKANGASHSTPSTAHLDGVAHNIDPQLRDVAQKLTEAMAPAPKYRPIAVKAGEGEPSSDLAKHKARGKFTEPRRKEVQNIRKLGACMRCRMLKKPCSDDTPCKQCSKIDSARLWRQPCFRTRLHDEFRLWSCGLFAIRAYQTEKGLREVLPFQPAPGRIEMRAFPAAPTYSTFACLRAQAPKGEASRPNVLRDEKFADAQETFMLAPETEDYIAKLEGYTRHLTLDYCEVEQSLFMKASLMQGRKLALNHSATLLLSVMELWLCTRLLCGKLPMELFYAAAESPTSGPLTTPSASGEQERIAITPEEFRISYDMLVAHLSAAAEKRGAVLAKFVLCELERRLVQRQQTLSFETFIVSITLLACAEEMCALYRSSTQERSNAAGFSAEAAQEEPNPADQQATQDPSLHSLEETLLRAAGVQPQVSSTSMPPDWPLEEPPSYFYRQGERLSDILHMLLKMRGIIPPSIVNEQNVICAAEDAPSAEAREWFEAVQLTDEALRSAAQNGGEMRYVGKLLDRC